jgi:predicted dehydrogenase
MFRFTAVAEPSDMKRDRFALEHSIGKSRSHADWERLLDAARPDDLVFICTPDRLHYRQAMAFMDKGCSIVLEKPVAVSADECASLGRAASEGKRRIVVCHVLRYTKFFSRLKELLDEGRIGRIVSINLQENIGYSHFAHSYVRGNWRSSALACPAVLAKSCHDLDMLYWLAGSRARRIASTGSLSWFKRENAPAGAPRRCLDGCPASDTCPWYAPDLYLTENTGWPASVISEDGSLEARIHALETGPYGRCVYHCDNDVVDHQHAMIDFANGVTASFVLCAFTAEKSREIRVAGTGGEIVGDLQEGWLEIRSFLTGHRERIRLNAPVAGHNGGDDALMNDIAALFGSSNGGIDSRSRLEESLEGHWMAFAAERSRASGTIVDMDGFKDYSDALSASGQ